MLNQRGRSKDRRSFEEKRTLFLEEEGRVRYKPGTLVTK